MVSALLIVAIIFGIAPAAIAFAGTSSTECDLLFAETINTLYEETDFSNGKIHAERKPLYDITLQPLGYVYEYSVTEGDGYAVFIAKDDEFIVQEVMPNAQSPYIETSGQCVYVSNLTYLTYSDGIYTDLQSSIELLPEAVESLYENAVYGSGGFSLLATDTELITILYESKQKSQFNLALSAPEYIYAPYPSCCACVAGANIIGYYDRYIEDLIPNFNPGNYVYDSDLYVYTVANEEVYKVVRQLYVDMGTDDKGTTVDMFKSGMKKYCDRKGLSITFTSCFSGNKFDYVLAKSIMQYGNQPIALFISNYHIAEMSEADGDDRILYYNYYTNHVMVGFGYKQIKYTYNSGATETYQLIKVSTGQSFNSSGYFNINYNSTLNEAYAIKIS